MFSAGVSSLTFQIQTVPWNLEAWTNEDRLMSVLRNCNIIILFKNHSLNPDPIQKPHEFWSGSWFKRSEFCDNCQPTVVSTVKESHKSLLKHFTIGPMIIYEAVGLKKIINCRQRMCLTVDAREHQLWTLVSPERLVSFSDKAFPHSPSCVSLSSSASSINSKEPPAGEAVPWFLLWFLLESIGKWQVVTSQFWWENVSY